jgi:hypothetical protein
MVGIGRITRFWENYWISKRSLADLLPKFYNISLDHNVTVNTLLTNGISALKFRRTLAGERLSQLGSTDTALCRHTGMGYCSDTGYCLILIPYVSADFRIKKKRKHY